ncbi:pantetheine-phosphate adenylyltransferase [Acidimicrobium ferrooxidans DSM 10331]|uniref:Phosphopantetheine adenylyltransferase n=1 Tax=Acidimicrobium ferrooxidans (strain DSM 10331 / JCM 15462 / NBRC 103882 / ICP) TaxID=525909 RepID=C7M0C9_ACIFD|nr:pantetheine-phosphate adenylyltransferase [Acidimicrobium ferrooxidans]ACU54437.1 pantetheine-phosphate adenylyltransferase [Acidimicrobium ferrooxidans DSM 10331]
MRRALFPGSFDPFHNGHREVVERASALFDEVVVAAMRNPQKASQLFSLDERMALIAAAVDDLENVRVVALSSLVVDLARAVDATVIVRGLRAVSDFEIELQMAQMNRTLSGVDTLFVPTSSEHSFLSSKLIREIAAYGGDVTSFVPVVVAKALDGRLGGRP